MPARNRRSSDYGARHKALRKQLLAALARQPGQPCARCGRPMYVSMKLHLDHNDQRTGYIGLSHASCNTRAGQAVSTARTKGKPRRLTPRQVLAMRMRQWDEASATAPPGETGPPADQLPLRW